MTCTYDNRHHKVGKEIKKSPVLIWVAHAENTGTYMSIGSDDRKNW